MQGWTVDLKTLPARFPTHRHDAVFWERLGRTIATFGFLEEVLGKAIFSFTATRPYKAAEIDSAFENWLPRLTRALTDPPGKLVSEFGKAVREHPQGELGDLDELLAELREALRIRNVLCHGSWRLPGLKTMMEDQPHCSSIKGAIFLILRSTARSWIRCNDMWRSSRVPLSVR